jgi:hypothetical protein
MRLSSKMVVYARIFILEFVNICHPDQTGRQMIRRNPHLNLI